MKQNYEFDPESVRFAALTDEEAKAEIKAVKTEFRELRKVASMSDPAKVWHLREIQKKLSWYKRNTPRSKYFKVITDGTFTLMNDRSNQS